MDLLTSASSVPSACWGHHWSWVSVSAMVSLKSVAHLSLLRASMSSTTRGTDDLLSQVLLVSACFLPVLWESEQVLVGCQYKSVGTQQILTAVRTLQTWETLCRSAHPGVIGRNTAGKTLGANGNRKYLREEIQFKRGLSKLRRFWVNPLSSTAATLYDV